MNATQLATPDNAADRTINLAISGNRLVSILNALDAAMHETGRYQFKGNDCVASSPWYQDLREVTEAVRDELSRQRCAPKHKFVGVGQCPVCLHYGADCTGEKD